MGFDITYHAIRRDEMERCFFAPMKALKEGDSSVAERFAEAYQAEHESFYGEKYLDIMKTVATWDIRRASEKGILYGMAVVSGFFTEYQYVRGSAYSFLIEEHPEMKRYCSPWKSFVPEWIPEPDHDILSENYAAGIYMAPEQVKSLLRDYEGDAGVRNCLETFFGDNLAVFLTSLRQASELESGLMEAAEVMEVNPFDLNKSTCYSDIRLCDPQGAFIYQKVAIEQVKAASGMEAEEIIEKVKYEKRHYDIPAEETEAAEEAAREPEKATEKKPGFFARLFGKK